MQERDLAHEADMRQLRREQLAADITVEEANEELASAPVDGTWWPCFEQSFPASRDDPEDEWPDPEFDPDLDPE